MIWHLYTGGKYPFSPGSAGPLVPVGEPGLGRQDKSWSRFGHEPGPKGVHVGALQRLGGRSIGPGSYYEPGLMLRLFFSFIYLGTFLY